MTAVLERDTVLSVARGSVGVLQSASHETCGTARSCVHLLDAAPDSMLVGRAAMSRLMFQPVVCPSPAPCIASRRGDVLTLLFDTRGPVVGSSHRAHRATTFTLRFQYRLHEFRWDDVDIVRPATLLAVLLPTDPLSPFSPRDGRTPAPGTFPPLGAGNPNPPQQ